MIATQIEAILENHNITNYKYHSFNIVGPDYDDFTSIQRAYLVLEKEAIFFNNCFGVQLSSTPDLLNEYDKVIVSISSLYQKGVLYEVKNSHWKNLTNNHRKKTPYLMPDDVIQEELKHYFIQIGDEEYWHILSNEYKISTNTEVDLRSHFNLVKKIYFAE